MPLSRVCCTEMGTTTRPAVPITASSIVQPKPSASSGENAQPARMRLAGGDLLAAVDAGAELGQLLGVEVDRSRGHPLGLVGVDQAWRRPGCGRAARWWVPAVGDPAAVEEEHLVGQRDRRLAVGDHAAASSRRRAGASPRGCGPRPRGRPPRSRRRGRAGAAAGPAPGPARAAGAGRRRGWCPAPPAGCRGRRGSAATNPSAWAVRRASHTSSSGMSAPRVTLPRTVSSKRNALCGTSDDVLAASWPRREVAQVLAVDADRARLRVDQPGHQRGERALAGGGRPDHGDGAAGLDREVQRRRAAPGPPRRCSRGRRPRARPRAAAATSCPSPYVVSLTVSRTRCTRS